MQGDEPDQDKRQYGHEDKIEDQGVLEVESNFHGVMTTLEENCLFMGVFTLELASIDLDEQASELRIAKYIHFKIPLYPFECDAGEGAGCEAKVMVDELRHVREVIQTSDHKGPGPIPPPTISCGGEVSIPLSWSWGECRVKTLISWPR